MNVKIKPKTKRAKERVKQHGEIMELINSFPDRIIVASLNNTWSNNTRWIGTFTNEEAEYEQMEQQSTKE